MNDEFDGYSSDFLEARRGQLLDLRAEITGRSRETLQQIMDQEREVGDSVDTSNEEQDTSTMLRLQDREASLLTEIEAALRRFEDDEYGECVECGDYINPRRLRHALPPPCASGARKRSRRSVAVSSLAPDLLTSTCDPVFPLAGITRGGELFLGWAPALLDVPPAATMTRG